MSTPLLEVDGLTVAYGDADPVVRDISFAVEAGKMTAIVGESGSGKTTSAMAALDLLGAGGTVLGGSIRFKGRELNNLTRPSGASCAAGKLGWCPKIRTTRSTR